MNDSATPTVPVEPGMFCWHEVLARDVDAIAAHYAELFGWNVQLYELPEETIRVFMRGNDAVAGCSAASKDRAGQGVRWRSFVAVDDVAGVATRASELGGETLVPATDLPMGTYAVVSTPGGAELGLFKGGDGRAASGTGAVMHNELLARELSASVRFHGELFGWHSVEHDMGTPYTVFHDRSADGPMRGGAMAPPPDAKLERDMWLPYVQVDDCDATAAKAESLGGRIAAAPMDIPTVGRIAVLLDPDFATIAVWTPPS